jgi:hypothetical protein
VSGILGAFAPFAGDPAVAFDRESRGEPPAWGDLSVRSLDGEGVVVTGIAEGESSLVVEVDADGKVLEVDDRRPEVVRVPVRAPDPGSPVP